MANGLDTTWQYIRSLLGVSFAAETTDAQLLARFIAEREEAAFAEIVRRHGPMVHGVCRRILGNPHDAEDAFQATFLVLSHKAASIRKSDSLSCWLHGVALRVAVRLRHNIQRRNDRTPLPEDVPQVQPDEVTWREVQRLLDEELARLPEQFRRPLILCYLEGKTRDEAAEQLGWSLSTFRGRLERARERLRGRLERRGVTLSAALLATLAANTAEAALPSITASSRATALATEVMRTMFLSKMKMAALGCLAVLFLSVAGGATAYHSVAVQPSPPPEAVAPPKPPRPPAPPEEDGLVKDFMAHLDTFHLAFTLNPKPRDGDEAESRYPLGSVQLRVDKARYEPVGRTYVADARITKDQAAKIVVLLAQDHFFREAVAEPDRLPKPKGGYVEMWAGCRSDGKKQPSLRWRTLDWNLHMVQQLEAIRQCVDGDAARHLDVVLKSLEAERREWEKKEVFTIKTVDDLDAIWGEDGTGKRIRVELEGVLPFNAWPRNMTDEQKKIRDDGLKLAKKWLEGKAVHFLSTRPPNRGNAVRYLEGPTKVEEKWTGKRAAEQTTAGGFDINVLLIQEGYSPIVQPGQALKQDAKTRAAYWDAEHYARINEKGIWKDVKLWEPLAIYGQNRTHLEQTWGIGPIKEWRVIASNLDLSTDDLKRGGLTGLFLSPDGKTVLTGGSFGGVQVLDAFSLKNPRPIWHDKRLHRALGFTSDNQPWLLWGAADDQFQKKPVGKTYHLVNATTDKERCSFELSQQLRLAALSPDGKYLAVTEQGSPSRIALWDAGTGKKVGDLGEHKHAIECLVFSPDGKTLATGSAHTTKPDLSVNEPGEIKLWEVENRKEKTACALPATCKTLQFTADGKQLFAATNRALEKESQAPDRAIPVRNEGWLVWFDAGTLKEQGRQNGPKQTEKVWVEAFAAPPNGKMLAVLWWEQMESDKRRYFAHKLRVYEVDTGKEIAAPEPWQTVQFLTFARDGNHLLAGGDQLGLMLWEALR